MSKSQLHELKRSPAHLRAYLDQERIVTPSQQLKFDIGTATHTALLEPDRLEATVVCRPPGDGRTKKVKDAVANLKQMFPDAIILPENAYRAVFAMRDQVLGHKSAGRFVTHGDTETEVSALWTDPETGLRCKARADAWNPASGMIVDVKTCVDARSARFRRSMYDYGYHLQASFYTRGFAQLGMADVAWVFLAIEKEPPHAICMWEPEPTWYNCAGVEIDVLLELYTACRVAGVWPAYSQDVLPITMEEWQIRDSEYAVNRTEALIAAVIEEGKGAP